MNQIDILTFLHEFSLNCLHRQRKQDFPLVSCRTSMLCTSQVSREHICNTVIAYSHCMVPRPGAVQEMRLAH